MDTTANRNDEFALVLERLTEAGVAFTIVDACPHPGCEVCAAASLSEAA